MSNVIKPICVVESPCFLRSGYSEHSRDIINSLIKYDKFDIKLVPSRWGACPPLDPDTNPVVKDWQKYILTQPLPDAPELYIQITIPNEFRKAGKYSLGITAGIETTIAPGQWIEGLNRMNHVIVPSNFAKEVLVKTQYVKQSPNGMKEDLKCNVPIDVIFEGADTTLYKKTKESVPSLNKKLADIKEDFVFLFVGHWIQGDLGGDRKDIGMLIKIFCETFKNKKKMPALLLKTSGATQSIMDRDECLKKISMIRSSVQGELPNVYLLHGDLTVEEINGLYNHPKVKAHVSFTHGEGYGRPLAEACLSGKPLIVSNWSGHVDFLNKEYCVLLPGSVQPVHPSAINDWIVKESQWFNVNYSIASGVLEDMYNNYEKFLPNAEKQRLYVEKNFSLIEMDVKFHEFLDKNLPKFEQKVELVLPKFKKIEPAKTQG